MKVLKVLVSGTLFLTLLLFTACQDQSKTAETPTLEDTANKTEQALEDIGEAVANKAEEAIAVVKESPNVVKPVFKSEQEALAYEIQEVQKSLNSNLAELKTNLTKASGDAKKAINNQIKKLEKLNEDLNKDLNKAKAEMRSDWGKFKADTQQRIKDIKEGLELKEDME